MDIKTIKVRICGRVQGVFFRYHTQLQAQSLDLAGWVRNCSDGSVEAVISGPEKAVEKMIGWLKQGPDSAAVTKVEISEDFHHEQIYHSFEILY